MVNSTVWNGSTVKTALPFYNFQNIISTPIKITNKMHYTGEFIIPSRLYMFRVMFSSIIRSTWLYLQYLVVFTQVAAGWCPEWVGWTLPDTVNTVKCLWWVSTHSGHQPAATWVNTTRYCKYSQVLLMMGENIARNMYSQLGIINQSI